MKTSTILASAFIFFALNVTSSATNTSDNLLNSIATNKSETASALNKNGRNQHLRANTAFQFTSIETHEVISKSMTSKGRNLEALDSSEENIASFASTGRNNKTPNEMISMY